MPIKKKPEYEGKPYTSMNKEERVAHRHKVWSEFSPMEQEAKIAWFRTPCCRQPQGSRHIGTEDVRQVECSGCGRKIKKIYPKAEVPDRSNAILGENSPDVDQMGRRKKEIPRRTDFEETVPF